MQNIDSPLSNAPWLLRQLELASSLPSEATKRHAIESLLSPTWPIDLEEGSFYDWVGSISAEDRPHLLMGEGVQSDPMHYFTPLLGGSGCTGRHYTPGSPQTEACLASIPLRRMSKVGVSSKVTVPFPSKSSALITKNCCLPLTIMHILKLTLFCDGVEEEPSTSASTLESQPLVGV